MEEEYASHNFDELEKSGKSNIFKYFDRIHDKLFTFNNILIVGFFTISKMEMDVSIKNILFPIANLVLLIFIEWYMMEISRTESEITKIPITDFGKRLYRKYRRITWFSLIEIASTTAITCVFLCFVFK